MTEKKFIVVPTSQIEQALRIPALWAETIGDVKEAEEIAKELALKHAKAYTVLYVVSTFKTETLVKKEDLA
jgi:hypothetical protein